MGENIESRKTKKKPLHKIKRILVNEDRLTEDTSKILGNALNIYGDASGITNLIDINFLLPKKENFL